jgi:hypothetical protein
VKAAGAVRSAIVVVPNISASTARRCRWLKINMRSVSSALTVRTNRSAKQFARGYPANGTLVRPSVPDNPCAVPKLARGRLTWGFCWLVQAARVYSLMTPLRT